MKIIEICKALEEFAPLHYQESYDNAGVQVGNPNDEATAVLLCIDITEEVVNEAINKKCNLIISHHPLIFHPIKSLTGKTMVERCVIKAIANNITIYSCHTNIDSVEGGVSFKMAEKIGLENVSILSEAQGELMKVVTYVPKNEAEQVRQALFNAGAGCIGNYDKCSSNANTDGTFRANDKAHPFVGNLGEYHIEPEIRIETIFPAHLKNTIEKAIWKSHPYEEPAYDFYKLENSYKKVGFGAVGTLKNEMKEVDFLGFLQKKFQVDTIRHTNLLNKPIKKVALCGGSGSFLISAAKSVGADIFITGDLKYPNFFEAENRLLIADIGHFESEQFTKEIFFEIIRKKIPNFVVYFSEVNTNPIKYYK